MNERKQTANVAIGQHAEEWACQHLRGQGLQLVQRNYRSRRGEIDLIMREGRSLVFVEVRARRGKRFGTAAESVTHQKQLRLIAAAEHFLQRHRHLAGLPARFDVVTIALETQQPEIKWFKDAFHAF